MPRSSRISRWVGPAVLSFALWGGAPAAAEDVAAGQGASTGGRRDLHVSSGAGVFLPWDGDRGFNVLVAVHKGLGSDRFWLGGEFEFRRYEAELKTFYEPDYDTFALRFSFQYHPFPRAVLSPYVGIGVGFQLSHVEKTHVGGRRVREGVGGGSSLLGAAGLDLVVPAFDPVRLFAEARAGNTTDLWKRKGGNFQTDQIDGFTGMAGVRLHF